MKACMSSPKGRFARRFAGAVRNAKKRFAELGKLGRKGAPGIVRGGDVRHASIVLVRHEEFVEAGDFVNAHRIVDDALNAV